MTVRRSCCRSRVHSHFSALWCTGDVKMELYFPWGLLFVYSLLPGITLGDLIFRCSSCTAEHLAACPEVTGLCAEIVREPGCGCCPVCARMEGEPCGVYTPRCSSGLRCLPDAESEWPLQQLIQGLGRCGQILDMDVRGSQEHQATNGKHIVMIK